MINAVHPVLTAISVQKHIDQQFFSIKHHSQIKVNFATSFFSDPASFSSRSLISAALSAEADVLSTTEEIIFILSETPVMQAACSSEEAEISAMFLSTSAVFFFDRTKGGIYRFGKLHSVANCAYRAFDKHSSA